MERLRPRARPRRLRGLGALERREAAGTQLRAPPPHLPTTVVPAGYPGISGIDPTPEARESRPSSRPGPREERHPLTLKDAAPTEAHVDQPADRTPAE